MEREARVCKSPVRPVLGLFAATVLALSGCSSPEGEAPTEVKLVAESDSTVKLTWVMPTGKTPNRYELSFRAVDESAYAVAATVWSPEATHDPGGRTGWYKVTASFGSNVYEAADLLTTVPVPTAQATVSELNAFGPSGYGWTRDDGAGGVYSMVRAASIDSVDFYVSDWHATAGDTYFLVSPELGPLDPGGSFVPSGSWHRTDLALVTSEQDPLPAYAQGVYGTRQPLLPDTVFCAIRTTDSLFGLAKVYELNPGAGTVKVETWLQMVKGLRLIQH